MIEIVKLDRFDEENVELKLTLKDVKRIKNSLEFYAEEIKNEEYEKLYRQFVDVETLMKYGKMGKE